MWDFVKDVAIFIDVDIDLIISDKVLDDFVSGHPAD